MIYLCSFCTSYLSFVGQNPIRDVRTRHVFSLRYALLDLGYWNEIVRCEHLTSPFATRQFYNLIFLYLPITAYCNDVCNHVTNYVTIYLR
jgi:hypothetical protein